MTCFRVKYRIEYDSSGDLYRLPKAPELIKIAHSVATDVFYDSSNDYEPEWVDLATLEYDYGGQWFFNVSDEKNMFVTSSEVTGTCLISVYKYLDYDYVITADSSDVTADSNTVDASGGII